MRILAVLLFVSACGAPPPAITVQGQTATLAATDPDLLAAVKSLTFLFYEDAAGDNSCANLVDLDAAGLNDRGPISHQGINTGDRTEHTFGAIREEGLRSFVVLGSTRELSASEQADPLPILGGTVNAIGCRELDVKQDTRTYMPIVLFPAGLR